MDTEVEGSGANYVKYSRKCVLNLEEAGVLIRQNTVVSLMLTTLISPHKHCKVAYYNI